MHVFFENSTVATFSRPSFPTKRKANAAIPAENEGPVKKLKLGHNLTIPTFPFTFYDHPTQFTIDTNAFTGSSNTSRSSTPASSSSEGRNKAGRPRRVTPPTVSSRRLKRATVLRCNRPVETQLPQDVWINIFKHSKPEFLFKARSFNTGFRDAILLDSIWKISLHEDFGPSLPEPPQGLSYMHYANLLTRHGCQACNEEKYGGRGKARRTYWAFQRRYCEPCLADKIIFARQLRQKLRWTVVHPYVDRMMECLPQAKYDSWGHYQWVGDYAETPIWATKYPNSQKIGFLEPAIDELGSELEIYLAQRPTEDEVDAWFDARIAVNKVLVTQLQAVEDFCERRRLAKLDETAKSKDARKQFYQKKALLMQPPLALEVLLECESYKRATNIHRAAVDMERSWIVLLPKLEKERWKVEGRQAEERGKEEEERRRKSQEKELSFPRLLFGRAFGNAGISCGY